MGAATYHYGEKALGFVERLETLTTQDAVIDALAIELADFGFENFVITGLPSPFERFEQVVMLRKWPAGWFETYSAEKYVEVDPVIRMCRQTVQPFEWVEAPYDPVTEPKAHELMRRAGDFGLKRGFSLPIHGVDGDACFSMSGSDLDLTPRTRPAIHLMAMYAYEAARQIAAPLSADAPNPLTPREREVLVWAAAGKTARDTAEILGVSQHTVVAHTFAATNKLGAANKTQAVSIAIKRRYIVY